MTRSDASSTLLAGLTPDQRRAVTAEERRVLVVAGAGSGKTEVMARRVAWWVGVAGVDRSKIVAFTFTDAAAEELKFRIREQIQKVAGDAADAMLGGMYVGTIHGFCIERLRRLKPSLYHNFDVLDEASRLPLVEQGYTFVLGLRGLQNAFSQRSKSQYGVGQYDTCDRFLDGYDLLNEYDILDVELPSEHAPDDPRQETDWCKQARLRTAVGNDEVSLAFARSVPRYYAYLRSRRFLDFSTSQSELTRLLRTEPDVLTKLRESVTHLVVDEVQDVNPVQDALVRSIVGASGHLTAVGDHRQAIYAFRGSRVDLMARLHDELVDVSDGAVVELKENYRSTPRIIEVANDWADGINAVGGLGNPRMVHGRQRRLDTHDDHVALLEFDDREEEANWIAQRIRDLVREREGAAHDLADGERRGISHSDVAVLLRSSTDARTYMDALRRHGIPAVVRAGPDLFSQPEVLLFLGCVGIMAELDRFFGGNRPTSLPGRCNAVLRVDAIPSSMIAAACRLLRDQGLPIATDLADRLTVASQAIAARIRGNAVPTSTLRRLRAYELKRWLQSGKADRSRARVFPQRLFHFCLAEAEVGRWNSKGGVRGRTALFHLGQMSGLIKGLETPGWVPTPAFKFRIAALAAWGSRSARPEDAPLLVAPDAVSVVTIHGAKGLEWPVVFLADVKQRRFPSQFARRQPDLPFDHTQTPIDPAALADDDDLSNERRLMYVALTRAERYLFVTRSEGGRSPFVEGLKPIFERQGGRIAPPSWRPKFDYAPFASNDKSRLATSFSDLRYFVECPHDFFLRKVLGFAPGIDEAFGYGRGVHNLMREVHSAADVWATLANDPKKLVAALRELIDRGLMYLRYTVGDPADAMKAKAIRIVADYVRTYARELKALQFEPEREFETLLPEANALVSGAIDVIRRDDPPRVTLIDFKSGDPESDARSKLDTELMKLQVSLYALAAKTELEYEPERGLVRYLDEPDPTKRELAVPFDASSLAGARASVVAAANAIQSRDFERGPSQVRDGEAVRCERCDFGEWCGRPEADGFRSARVRAA